MSTSQVWRLRAYSFCHGLAFHAIWHTVHLKEVLLGGSYEAIAFFSALQVVALWTTEAFSGTLCRQIGCWRVLRLCGWVRMVALACLGLCVVVHGDYHHHDHGAAMALLVVWSICEGVARALYSGSDTQLLYEISPNDAPRNMAIQHGMWPLAMVVSAVGVGTIANPNMALLIFGSWCAALASLCFVRDDDKKKKNVAPIPWRLLHPACIWRANQKALQQIWSNSHLRRAWFVSIAFALLCDTLNRLRPFAIPTRTLALTVGLTFFGSFVGSACLSGLFTPTSRWWHLGVPLLVYVATPCLWWTGLDALVYVGSFSVSLAFGALKSQLQADLFRHKSTGGLAGLSKSEILSTFHLSSQTVHSIWMCLIVSPLLDWQPTLLTPWVIAGNSLFFSVTLLALIFSHDNKDAK